MKISYVCKDLIEMTDEDKLFDTLWN